MKGIGIDTGGTYTDAVIFDFDTHEVLSQGKALTTKRDLKIGISNVLDQLSPDLLKEAQFLSLSTTLATNACVEGIGGRAKLVFIGVEPKTVEEFYASYGLPHPSEIYFLEKPVKNWEMFQEDIKESFLEYDSVAIVEIFAQQDQGNYEKEARSIIEKTLNLPCVCGYELFQELNVLKRGSSALLNARLLPVIKSFLSSIQEVLQKRGLSLPIVVVRSDGSLMSLAYTLKHPVDTLLCGPAASIMAGTELTHQADALIVDMGGTTTDVAIVKDKFPVTVRSGISIGTWKTFVKGLYVDTFGLGGDSAIRFDKNGLFVDTRRVVPLCCLAAEYPSILSDLRDLVKQTERPNLFCLHECFILLQDISQSPAYSDLEKRFCQALKSRPLRIDLAAKAVGRDVYGLKFTERLEQEGIVMRAGLTPTDIMHLRGDFSRYDPEASRLGAAFVGLCTGFSVDGICEQAYELVRKKLYFNLARILLKFEHPYFEKEEGTRFYDQFLEDCYQTAKNSADGFSSLLLTTKASLVGIGAPIHIFLEDVAKLLGTTALIPPYAPVANALGAAIGNVSVTFPVELKPVYSTAGIEEYLVFGLHETLHFDRESLEEARHAAMEEARRGAVEKLLERGAIDYEVTVDTSVTAPTVDSEELLLKEVYTGKSKGKIHGESKDHSAFR